MFVQILMNKFILLPPGVSSWAPAGIFPERGGAKPRGLTKMTKAQTKIFAFFRRLRLNLRVFDVSAEGASKNFKDICTKAAYDIIIFKFQGGGNCARLPPSGRMGIMYRSFLPSILFCCDYTNSMSCKYNIPTNQYTCNTRMHGVLLMFWCNFFTRVICVFSTLHLVLIWFHVHVLSTCIDTHLESNFITK